MCSRTAVPAAVLLLGLAGCNTVDSRTGSTDRQFGEAVAWNKALHTINPDPVYADDATPAGSNGAKAAAATERYRTDKVKQLERVTSTQVSGSGGGGSGPQ